MNAFRTISRVLVVTAVVFVGTTSAAQGGSNNKNKAQLNYHHLDRAARLAAPVLTKELLKGQNVYFSAVGEAAVATAVNGHLSLAIAQSQAHGQSAAQYFAANAVSRALAATVAANTRLNRKNFEDVCDLYIGAVPYVGTPVSETIKKVTPSIVETAHNSVAASVKNRELTLEFSITL